MNKTRAVRATVMAAMICAAGPRSVAEAAPRVPSDTSLMRELVDTLNSGDQASYERFVQKHYAPATLAEYDAENQAALLARIYTDTGGLAIERIAGQAPGWVQAEARARLTGIRYCLTLNRSARNGRDFITEFGTRDLYPAGPNLKTPTAAEVVAEVERLANAYAARDLLSGVILLAKGNEVIFKKAYGSASIAYRAPMTVNTRLNVASIGKSLTGVAIAQLVDAGKLSFDDTVGKLWPDYPDKDVRDKVTVRQLLTHTSGMGPKDTYEHALWPVLKPRLRSVSDYMKLVVGTPLGAEPGTRYLYSNAGYVLLGALIERVSGQNFYDYVQEHIFKPAGMTRSFYHELDQEDPDVAVPLTNLFNKGETAYIYRLGQPRNAIYELAVRGGPHGGAYVTADDLFAFEKAFRAGKLVSAATMEKMTTAQGVSGAGVRGLSGDVRAGLGVEVIKQNGHSLFGHPGGDLGIASIVYWYPDSDYTTIILSNHDPRAVRVMTNATRALLTRQTINGATPPQQGCIAPAAS